MSLLSRAKAKLRLRMLSEGAILPQVIEHIPKTMEPFDASDPDGDQWVEVIYPESINCTGALYKGKKGSIFLGHMHKGRGELISCVEPGSEIEIVTDKEIRILKFPDAMYIPAGVPHAAVFIKESYINLMWTPKFEKGWDSHPIEIKEEDQI